ncbi:MAG TPA: NAD(P)-dependent oxidoreductase [Gemmatimonadaceae bacterium]|nr:NAD(P)-dependent oxidoreductase [Gemmatimonadaceae bacterium]
MRAVTLLGLGTMGNGMANQLLAAGFPLTVWNRSSAKARALEAAGARVAETPRLAAAAADVIISMVADDAASRAVWMGESGALAGARAGTVLIECSTVSPGWIEELGAAARERGCALIDAPVTGSRAEAESGRLLFLAGGAPAVIEQVGDVLDAMGRGVLHLGPLGSGAFVKLVNNFVCGVQVAALAEAVTLIESSELDRDRALSVLLQGAPGSPLVKGVASRMLEPSDQVNFAVDLMAKDLTYAASVAAAHHIDLATARAALQLFHAAGERGLGRRDIAAVIEAARPTAASAAEHA